MQNMGREGGETMGVRQKQEQGREEVGVHEKGNDLGGCKERKQGIKHEGGWGEGNWKEVL